MRPSLALFKNTSRSALNYKRAQTGLYDGRSIQSGNNVGETFNNKTRRRWLPNVHSKRVYSEALGRSLALKVTAGALRTIDKVGGLDKYLFRVRPERLGDKGMELRQMVRPSSLSLPLLDLGSLSAPPPARRSRTRTPRSRQHGEWRRASRHEAGRPFPAGSLSRRGGARREVMY